MTPAQTFNRMARPAPKPGVTTSGWMVFAMGLALFGSTFAFSRIAVGGFMVHPVLLLTAPSLLIFGPARIREFPRRLLAAMVLFVGVWVLISLIDTKIFYELPVKLFTTELTIVTVALMVRNEHDYRWGVYGLVLGVTLMGTHGLLTGSIGSESFNPVEVGNKNAFSLYALPALLMGVHLALEGKQGRFQQLTLIGGSLAILLTIFSSANRSGWLGAVVIGVLLMLTYRKRLTATMVVGLLLLGTIWILTTYLDIGVFERRMDQTMAGYQSDDLREQLFIQCFWIGVDHPLLGIGPYQINFELARRVTTTMPMVGPHNAITFIFGAGGLALLSAWLNLGAQFWRFGLQAFRSRLSIVHVLLALWVVRGAFSDEVLYSPAFAIAFGLAIGLGMTRLKQAAAAPVVPVRPRPELVRSPVQARA